MLQFTETVFASVLTPTPQVYRQLTPYERPWKVEPLTPVSPKPLYKANSGKPRRSSGKLSLSAKAKTKTAKFLLVCVTVFLEKPELLFLVFQ